MRDIWGKLKDILACLRGYVKRESFINTIISTALILLVSLYVFKLETQRIRNNERIIYGRTLQMLLVEIDMNSFTLYDMRTINEQTYELNGLSDDVIKNLISNPQTYIFTGKEFHTLLQNYLFKLNVLRNEYMLFNEARYREKEFQGLVSLLVPKIHQRVEEMIRLSYLLEKQTILYEAIYHGGLYIQVPNYDEVIKEMKGIPAEESLDEINKMKSENKKTESELYKIRDINLNNVDQNNVNKMNELLQVKVIRAVLKVSTKEAEKLVKDYYEKLDELQSP